MAADDTPVRRRGAPDPRDVRSALVFFSRGLGDHILALPTMRALCALFPGRLTLLVSHSAPDLFFGDAGFARIVEMDMDFGATEGLMFDPRLAADKLGPHDLFLSILPGGVREWAQLAAHLEPRWTVGVAEGFSCRIAGRPSLHAVEQTFTVPRAFHRNLLSESFAHPFPLPPAAVQFAGDLRSRLRGRRLLLIHGETKPEKQWAPESWQEMLKRFLIQHPEYVGVELFRRQSALGAEIDGVLPLQGLPLASAIALAASADLLVCADSVFLHAADLWRTPTVALFGATPARVWGARFNPWCRHLQAAGMDVLKVPRVLSALNRLAAHTARIGHRPFPLCPGGDPDLIRWD